MIMIKKQSEFVYYLLVNSNPLSLRPQASAAITKATIYSLDHSIAH